MHLRDILRAQLAKAQADFGTELRILETGTIRSADPQYELDDGWSTLHFAEWVREHGGWCESVDLDTDAAREVLTKRGYSPTEALLHRAHSIRWLGEALKNRGHYEGNHHASAPALHLAYLDSDNDPSLILNEYLLVAMMMPSGGIVMVDDCDPATGGHKGDKIRPWLDQHGQAYELVRRNGVGYATNVLITRVP